MKELTKQEKSKKETTAIDFFKHFLTNKKEIGAWAASSPRLAKQMFHHAELPTTDVIVELGPGTGSFTSPILEQKSPDSVFFALEIHKPFVEQLQAKHPQAEIYHDSADRLEHYLQQHDRSHADVIVSSIPWANLPEAEAKRLMKEIMACIKPGGKFISFAYIHSFYFRSARKFRKHIKSNFAQYEVSPIVWKNFPPAVVYTCTK